MSLKSPLGRVLGAGSAKEGTGHWWSQRVTSVALLLLGPWFLISLGALDDYSEAALATWAARPTNAIMLILLCLTVARHSSLGVQVVVEDYVHARGLKVVTLLASGFLHVLLAVAGAFAVLYLALGGNS